MNEKKKVAHYTCDCMKRYCLMGSVWTSSYEHKRFVEVLEMLQLPQTQLFTKKFCLTNKIKTQRKWLLNIQQDYRNWESSVQLERNYTIQRRTCIENDFESTLWLMLICSKNVQVTKSVKIYCGSIKRHSQNNLPYGNWCPMGPNIIESKSK